MTVDDLPTVGVSENVFRRLLEYSCSIPTGTTIGKWWKREQPRGSGRWLLGCFGPSRRPDRVRIHWRRLDWYPWLEDHEQTNADDLPPINLEASFR